MNLENIRSSYHCRHILNKNKAILLSLFPPGKQIIEFDLFWMYKLRLYVNHKLTLLDLIERMSGVEFVMGTGSLNSGNIEYHCVEFVCGYSKEHLQERITGFASRIMIIDRRDGITKLMPVVPFRKMKLARSGPTAAGSKENTSNIKMKLAQSGPTAQLE